MAVAKKTATTKTTAAKTTAAKKTTTAKPRATKAKAPSVESLEEARVREIAHQLWLEAGSPEGDDQKFWFEAQAVALRELTPKKTTRARKTTKAA